MNYLNSICEELVSPPKLTYSAFDLGSVILQNGRRIDFNVVTSRKTTVKCSLYISTCNKTTNDTNKSFKASPQYCVVYLHSMNGSRLQCTLKVYIGLPYLQKILALGYSFCSFDFSGCGNSTGENISFGANEKYDAHAVILELESKYSIKKIILWGRSMGAVCAIKYSQFLANELQQSKNLENNNVILGLILDSPFKSLKELFVELGSKMSSLPSILVKAGFHVIKSKIQTKAQFCFEELQLQYAMNSFSIPILFLASKQDATIPVSHSEDLFDIYQHHEKQLKFINGLHNQSRDHEYIENVKSFIKIQFQKKVTKPKKVKNLYLKQLAQRDSDMEDINKSCVCSLFQVWNTADSPTSSDRLPTSLSTKTPRSKVSGSSRTSLKLK